MHIITHRTTTTHHLNHEYSIKEGINLPFTINCKEGDSSYIIINFVNVSSYSLLFKRIDEVYSSHPPHPHHFLSYPYDLVQWKMRGSDNILNFKRQCVFLPTCLLFPLL